MSRRFRIANEKPKAYRKVFAGNLKPLGLECCPNNDHCWVPATTIWIHDGAKGSSKIGGFARRGLHEAMPYKWRNFQVTPQVCWNCMRTREHISQILTMDERRNLAEHIVKDQQHKPKGRKGAGPVLTDIEMFFDNAEALL